jgi:hypothetical protein
MLKIGQRWRHIYDGINNGCHDYHNFVVEIMKIDFENVTCQILQMVQNNNQTWHAASKMGDNYLVRTIPRDVDYIEGANGANTWMLLHGQDKTEEPLRKIEHTYSGMDLGITGRRG